MTRSILTTAILALVLAGCAGVGVGRQPEPRVSFQPAYSTSDDAAQAPLFSGATVTGDTIREDK